MAYEFKKHKMVDGRRYGPTSNGWYYQPADYHGKTNKTQSKKGKKSKNREHEDKTHWILTQSQQYDVFLEGVEGKFMDKKNMFSVIDNCNVVMGEDNERIALFPVPPTGTVDWHGYPVSSEEEKLTNEIMDKFLKAKAITLATYSRMLRRDL